MKLHTVSSPVPPPAGGGQWINVTSDTSSLVQLGICIGFLHGSTAISHGNSNAGAAYNTTETALQRNLEAKRATVWLWQDKDANSQLTIVFHASDGNPTAAVTTPRFFVCAGLDPSLSSDVAYPLLSGAVSQFININNITREKIFLWTEKGNPPQQGDLIYDIFNTATQKDFNAPLDETFNNRRFPNLITTYQLK